jgi:hypothetical protein
MDRLGWNMTLEADRTALWAKTEGLIKVFQDDSWPLFPFIF